jgi:hypothetical protein
MKAVVFGFAALAVIGLAQGRASAATLTVTGGTIQVTPNANGLLVNSSSIPITENSSTDTLGSTATPQIGVGSSPDTTGWDPWGNGNPGPVDTNSRWLSVGGSGSIVPGSATFTTGSPVNVLSLLWGSPNSGNSITFFSGMDGGGANLGTVDAASITSPNNESPGYIWTITSSSLFESFVLNDTGGGFEVADLDAQLTTPLPSTWTMLIAGFVGLGFFAYRGSKKGSAAIAVA